MRIASNVLAMNVNRQYTLRSGRFEETAEKLATGYEVNSAADNAAGLAISEKMRSQIRGLGAASKNSQDAASLIQTAEGALTEVHNLLQRMNELAVESATGTNEGFDRTQLAKEFERLKREINDISEQTTFNNITVLDGTLSAAGLERSAYTSGIYKTFQEVLPTSEPSSIDSVILDGGRLFQAGSNRNSFDLNFTGSFGVFAAKAAEVTIAGKTFSINNRTINNWGTADSLDDLAKQINSTGGIEMTLATGEKQTLEASRVGGATLRFTAKERVLASDTDLNKLASQLTYRVALPAGGAPGDINANGTTGTATVATKDNSNYATSAKKTFSFDFSKAKAGASFEIGDRLFLFEDSKNNSKTMREKLAEREKQYLSSGENKSVTRVDLAIVDNEDMLINTINAAFSEADGIVQRQAADNSSGVSYNELKEAYDKAYAEYEAAMNAIKYADWLLTKANTASKNAADTLKNKTDAYNTAVSNREQGERDRDAAVAAATNAQTARDTALYNLNTTKGTLTTSTNAKSTADAEFASADTALQAAQNDKTQKETLLQTATDNLNEAIRQLNEANAQKATADGKLTTANNELQAERNAYNTAHGTVTSLTTQIGDQNKIITDRTADATDWANKIGDGTSAGFLKDYNDKNAIYERIGEKGTDEASATGQLYKNWWQKKKALDDINNDPMADAQAKKDAQDDFDAIEAQITAEINANPNYVQERTDALDKLNDAQQKKLDAENDVAAARAALGNASGGLIKDLADAETAEQIAWGKVEQKVTAKNQAQAEVDRLNTLINGDTSTGVKGLDEKHTEAVNAKNAAQTARDQAVQTLGEDKGNATDSTGAWLTFYQKKDAKTTADANYASAYDAVHNATTGTQKLYNDAETLLTQKRTAETNAINRLGDNTKGLIKAEKDALDMKNLAITAKTNADSDVVKAGQVKDAAVTAGNTPTNNWNATKAKFEGSAAKAAYDAVFEKYKYQLAQEVKADLTAGGSLIRLEYVGTDAAKRDSLNAVGLQYGKKGIDNLGVQGDKYLTMAVHAMDKRGLGEVTYELDLSKLESGDTITWENKNGRVYTHRYMEGDSLEKIYDQLGISKDETITIDGNTWKVQNESKKIGTLRIGFEARDDIEAYKRGTLKMQVGAREGEQLNLNLNALNTKTLKLDDAEIYTQQDASAAITSTREAINAVSDQRAAMGAMQNRLSHKMQNLSVSIENLQVSESRIRDVDMASQMTEFTKSNILAQAATSMLAQANSNSQLVLSLLRS